MKCFKRRFTTRSWFETILLLQVEAVIWESNVNVTLSEKQKAKIVPLGAQLPLKLGTLCLIHPLKGGYQYLRVVMYSEVYKTYFWIRWSHLFLLYELIKDPYINTGLKYSPTCSLWSSTIYGFIAIPYSATFSLLLKWSRATNKSLLKHLYRNVMPHYSSTHLNFPFFFPLTLCTNKLLMVGQSWKQSSVSHASCSLQFATPSPFTPQMSCVNWINLKQRLLVVCTWVNSSNPILPYCLATPPMISGFRTGFLSI